jgi:lipoprotein-anchoring transpeptidase ErfK/SrfK
MKRAFVPDVHRLYMFALALVLAPGITHADERAVLSPSAQQMIAVQVALDRAGFSPGEIDGRDGPRTRLALAEFQQSSGLRPTGVVNQETLAAFGSPAEPLTTDTITQQDIAGPFIDAMPADMMESARLQALAYTSVLEALAEKFHASPVLIKSLNPGAAWAAGDVITVPAVDPFVLPEKSEKSGADGKSAAFDVVISGAAKSLAVRGADGKILMHAPVTIGSSRDPLPVGDWKVVGVSWNPTFNYNPDLFWDADPAHAKAKVPPGPNNPVGVVWVDINKEHFGLHGTPEPSTIGRTESHGCIRLTNWDATKLGRLVSVGTKVTIR